MAGEFCNTVWKKLDKMVGTKVSKLYAEDECKLGGVAQESKLYSPDSGVGKLVVCNEINFFIQFLDTGLIRSTGEDVRSIQ